MEKRYLRFEKLSVVCIVGVYLVILAGGVVRSTGSGMGCPDWPRCFGKIMPPTNESELPPDYQEKYKEHGYSNTRFDPVKTWIEYINRLLTAVLGVLVLSLFGLSFIYKNKDKTIIYLTGWVLFLVMIEALVGKYVVSTNLKPITVSVHMWGSIIIALLLIYIVCRVRRKEFTISQSHVNEFKTFVFILIGLSVIQALLGTNVRQDIDQISAAFDNKEREKWIEQLGYIYYIHRSFSILILIAHFYFVFRLRKTVQENNLIIKSGYALVALVVLESVLGITLGYLGVPALVQPFHMLMGSLIFGVQFFILVLLYYSKQQKELNTIYQ